MFLPKMFQIPQMFGQTEEKYTDLWEAKLKILARKRKKVDRVITTQPTLTTNIFFRLIFVW